MSNQMMARTLGFLEDPVLTDAKMLNNNSLMALLKTIAQYSTRSSVKTDLALDGGSVADVFTINGGYVLVEGLVLFLTEVVSNNACNMSWGFDPTIGAADIPIGSALDIDSLALGDMIWMEGDATACVVADQATNAALMCTVPMLGPPGGIDMDMANSNPTTGIADVVLVWRPITPDAYVTVG